MSFQSIRVEGTLFSSELIAKLDDGFPGQAPKDFGLGPRARVRDTIMEAWGDLSEQWHVFKRRRERLAEGEIGTTETRRFWMEPFFASLGFDLELQKSGETIQGRNYAISHRETKCANLPVHIAGCGTSLDQKPGRGGLSPHALVQEYLNLTDTQLFALVTNGIVLRLVRDCGRISRLSYVEFDLEHMFEGDLYAEFALLYRFLHASRFSADPAEPAACIIEEYHQESVEEGGRIRAHLSEAVESAIRILGNGFLEDGANDDLRVAVKQRSLIAADYYHELLLLVYRLLFLMVIEERGLVFGPEADLEKVEIYDRFYSIRRLRKLTTTIYADLDRHADWYRLLGEIFALFDEKGSGAALGIAPLGGDLFRSNALQHLSVARLSNRSLRDALACLDSFQDEKSRLPLRVNYASLNVEEFGSVYEGLLELEPVFTTLASGLPGFDFAVGTTRGDTGSHYTPDELVQKLVKAGVEPAIDETLAKVKAKGVTGKAYAIEAEKALLALRILDSACGSGHMLLGAARRVGLELARVRYGEDQPSPVHFRQAVRDAISHCVYGVDMNPLAVELCKVALWLEAHEPGKPLGFLDHRIKCGDSLAGLGRFEELEAGIPDEAFKAKPGDDKKTAGALAKRNAKERDEAKVRQTLIDFGADWASASRMAAASGMASVEAIPDDEIGAADEKRARYERWKGSAETQGISTLANIKVAQYFLPILEGQAGSATTEGAFRAALKGEVAPERLPGHGTAAKVARERRFFHWFAEFPGALDKARDGFDVVIGNPPFLGGQKLSGTFGAEYLSYLKAVYPPAGAMDLVGFFFRRNYELLRAGGRLALIATKTIAEGGTREGSLDVITKSGTIYWAVKSMPWPGKAAVSVSLAAIAKGKIPRPYTLNGKRADTISPYLDDTKSLGNPFRLVENAGKSFQGSIVLGAGFVLEPAEAEALISRDSKNRDVLFPYLNGEDLNSRPDGSPSRWVINFFDWPLRRKRRGEAMRPEDEWECAPAGYVGKVAEDYPDCLEIVERLVKPERLLVNRETRKRYWWLYAEQARGLYRAIAGMERVMTSSAISKYMFFSFSRKGLIYNQRINASSFSEFCFFSLLQSDLHEAWARKNSSTLETRLSYSLADAFETFPFPLCLRPVSSRDALESAMHDSLESIGKTYYKHRAALMKDLNLGLTKTYNLFHDDKLTKNKVAEAIRKSEGTGEAADCFARIMRLRELHAEMDLAVLKAYGWVDIKPEHGFYELDFLPENDRVRYTIAPAARRTVLERLLELNFQRHAEEEMQGGVKARVISGSDN
jgi:hypothetical protein